MPTNDSPLQLLFLGTGTSTGLPLTPCLTQSNPYPESFSDMVPLLRASELSTSPLAHIKGSWNPDGEWPSNIPCPCCRSAVDPDVPEGWKNKRGNTSVLVRRKDKEGVYKNILVDVGKTFREQAGRFFPKWGVQTIDAVLLTHGHADAYFGLDDLREWCIRQRRAIPVYLNQPTYEAVCTAFPYMVDKTKASGGGDVPTLLWNIIEDHDEFEIAGVNVKSMPVHHGIYFHTVPSSNGDSEALPVERLEPEPLICLSFMFDNSIVYISDVSSIPDKTWHRISNRHEPASSDIKMDKYAALPTPDATPTRVVTPQTNGEKEMQPLPILVIDALWPLRPHTSHFSFLQALETALRLRSSHTYLVGSTHPTTHFMWEELCLSLLDKGQGRNGKREHPDSVQSEYLVDKVWKQVLGSKKNKDGTVKPGFGDRWKKEFESGAGIVRPAWDGLVVQIPADEQGEVERPDQSTRGLVY
ncbi:hypothetical protein I317_01138 [Kwoniella heveanensis CBS 569]|nr:hypothetical protein I317_01138 [Kwoniella heveanensis CBS 569]